MPRPGSRPAPPGYAEQVRKRIVGAYGAGRRGYPGLRRPPPTPGYSAPPAIGVPADRQMATPLPGTTGDVPGAPGAPPGPGGLPLSPQFEQGRRTLDDILSANLAKIGAARGQVPLEAGLQTARMRTEQTEDERRTREGANARGIFHSGILGTDLNRVGQGYGRRREDLAGDLARRLSGLADEESGARLGYQSGLSELLMQSAQQSAMDQSAPGFSDLPYEPNYFPVGMAPGFGGRRGEKSKPSGKGKPGKKKGKN